MYAWGRLFSLNISPMGNKVTQKSWLLLQLFFWQSEFCIYVHVMYNCICVLVENYGLNIYLSWSLQSCYVKGSSLSGWMLVKVEKLCVMYVCLLNYTIKMCCTNIILLVLHTIQCCIFNIALYMVLNRTKLEHSLINSQAKQFAVYRLIYEL